ncbi:MAG: 5'-3'-deoxyribonucleotidase [Pseudomonadota bacterium]|nr:5'-3'-deoxyribonucleotidase [Pseudomonadota bacterium]
MLILLDQDGVLADFERGFHDGWNARGDVPCPALPLAARQSFYVRDDYPSENRDVVEGIYTAPGFFRDLPPMPGAIEAVAALLAQGHDVRICTSPLNQWRHCVTEKYEWVERHLGTDFVHRMIVTKDKTVVYGDVLVDDKPAVTGTRQPVWQHVIFDQPYNRHVAGPRMTWASWQAVLPQLARRC